MGDIAELGLPRRPGRKKPSIQSKPKAASTTASAPVAPSQTPRTKKKSPITSWSMYQALHDEVSSLLVEVDLHFEFYEHDDEGSSIRERDTNIMGRFVCHNQTCKSAGWSSKKIATTIRLYPGQTYNARVYHQRCKICKSLSRPVLDQSYAERIVYWIKRWNGVQVERPSGSRDSRGPHNSELCEGCRVGHCSQSDDWVTQLEMFVPPKPA
ncbi:uncharacterized protein N7479_008683 [Penicillium vulpinum]|uniref:3CxxC-type domain-containing protein n=1 Tax=Penicillium vulpinum TaxID=29845 RepID=A0A1V6S0Z9_9EURO|nr:uncharacterized protein N7479_008683 [Penicillium vulpinum]KAJ5950270.1 hypothetical protein N7479_008683 [Penicillium vulpinum]OQE07712.1 hypothetical protein PENVUL_c012G05199 [Penicillium vulpinum]